jgi:ribonuclease P protein component
MTPDDTTRGATPPPADASAGPPPDERFRRTDRVLRRQDYQAVYDRGLRLSGSFMTVFFLPNRLGRPRLGIAATRKIGPAVVRNRAKRRVREMFRRERPAGADDIVVIPRRDLVDAPGPRLLAEFRGILKRRSRQPRD